VNLLKDATSSEKTRFDTLRSELRGELLEPDDQGYNEARQVWNAMIDKYPTAIAKCSGTADVIVSVNYVRENESRFSVKSGGHHVTGTAVCNDGLVIDLSDMNGIWVDTEEQTAHVQAGATWGDVDHETQAFGLATVGGQDPNIGVAGMTLGGGIGWLSRKYGLTIDHLLEVELVTADGRLVTASESENSDLFWALRGGGGNFGIATSFRYQLHELGPEVLAGSLIHPIEDAASVAQFYEEFME
jgi:FAD/FMN-containing dehydrogenase